MGDKWGSKSAVFKKSILVSATKSSSLESALTHHLGYNLALGGTINFNLGLLQELLSQ